MKNRLAARLAMLVAVGAGTLVAAPAVTSTSIAHASSQIGTEPTTTVPPDPMKLCLGKTFAVRKAIKHEISVLSSPNVTAADAAAAAAAVQEAEDALFRCLNGSSWY